jgi:hypothetical protein
MKTKSIESGVPVAFDFCGPSVSRVGVSGPSAANPQSVEQLNACVAYAKSNRRFSHGRGAPHGIGAVQLFTKLADLPSTPFYRRLLALNANATDGAKALVREIDAWLKPIDKHLAETGGDTFAREAIACGRNAQQAIATILAQVKQGVS